VRCRDHYDVVVVGAGAAGVTAAAAAAHAGGASLSVALIESSHRLGGAVTAAMHRSLCGLYSDEPRGPLDSLNAGMQRDVVSRMVERCPQGVAPRRMGKTWVLQFPVGVYEGALEDVLDRPGIDRLMGCQVREVGRKNGRVSCVRIEGATNCQLEVRVLIDCTGAGSILRMCGEGVALASRPADRMLGGYSVRVGEIEGDLGLLPVQVPYVLTGAVSDGKLPVEARFTMFQPGPGPGAGVCKLAVHPEHSAQEDVELFARAVIDHLKHSLPAFARACVVETSPRPVARDGLRIRGQYVVTEEDVLSARCHGADEVHGWWPVEFWDCSEGPTYAYPPVGRHYGVPRTALRSAVIPNLLAAGTCVSATPRAAASIRASGICLATGNAAGEMAAEMANRA
jgi:glycine/D-amino acid oxidase-like deaminating enzyme